MRADGEKLRRDNALYKSCVSVLARDRVIRVAKRDRQRGKAFERHVAALFGGRRRRSGEGLEFDDCVAKDGSPLPISLECKAYDVLQLRAKWVEQAERNCDGRPWAIVQRRKKGSPQLLATVDLEFLLSLMEVIGQ